MTDKRAQARRKLVASGSLLVVIAISLLLSLIILFESALGWFAQNDTVSGGTMANTGKTEDAHADDICYVYNIRTSALETQDLDDLEMQPYDMIFEKRDRYTPAIVCVTLDDIAPEFRSGGTLTVTITRDTTKANNALNDYFSSIMRITAAVGSSYYSANNDTLYGNIDAALYTTVKGYPENYASASSKTFTTVVGGTGTDQDPYRYSKADSITLTVPYTAADKNGSTLYLYL